MKQENNLMPCDQVLGSVLSTPREEFDRKGGWEGSGKKQLGGKIILKMIY